MTHYQANRKAAVEMMKLLRKMNKFSDLRKLQAGMLRLRRTNDLGYNA